jgi:L-lactate utilization protein LutB
MDEIIKTTIKALNNNNMPTKFVETCDEAKELVMSMISEDDVIGAGGSMTLDQCKIRDELREKKYDFLDWFLPELPMDKKKKALQKTLGCDVFLTSTNALTMDGKLYNVDGRGNRVAAMVYGPKKVIILTGKNKIVKNLQEAKERMETVAAPLNAKKLNRNTGCRKTGYCVDCKSEERICRHFLVTDRQKNDDRINIIIVNENLGL